MKKIFTSILLFIICFSAKAQTPNADVFDFDLVDTFYYYWGTYIAEPIDSRLIIDTVAYKHNQWQIGKPNKRIFDSAYTLPNVIVTDTSFPCRPNDTSVFVLKLPYARWPYSWALRYLSFTYKLDIDSGDIALVEASIDSGQTWKNIMADTSLQWNTYPSRNLSVSTAGWDSVTSYPYLFTVSNDTVYVRFTFITCSDTTARDGWIIDHIIAQHYTEDVPGIANDNGFQLYPSPATNQTKLKFMKALNTDCQMLAIDALGRQVSQHRLYKGGTEYTLDVKDWVKGIYFIELDDGKGNRTTEKLMVE